MAKNDYFVIVYKVLGYLYDCLKKGLDPNLNYLDQIFEASNIGSDYSDYIYSSMYKEGLIQGISLISMQNKKFPGIKFLQDFTITPLGIEYLQNNSSMAKAAEYLKSINDILPWGLL